MIRGDRCYPWNPWSPIPRGSLSGLSMLKFAWIAVTQMAFAFAVATAGRTDDVVGPAELRVVQHRAAGVERTTRSRVLVTAADGGLLLEARDGQLVTVKPSELVANEATGEAFNPATADELTAQLQAELGADFEMVRTKRYVIATNAGRAYGQWCGRLLERLQVAFIAHWKKAGLNVAAPDQPLVAIIWAQPEQFAAYAAADAGAVVAQSQGYYSIRTNRVILTDLTREPGQRAAVNDGEILRRVESRVANLTTVVHEATHQIAFNCGLHTRYADNPMWLTEGMAMYCEAPDLKRTSGWGTIGRVHPGRLQHFREFVQTRRQPGSLTSLVLTEDRFRDPATAIDAYAESWALTYYLLQEHRAQYVAYLELLATRPRLVWDTPEQRERAFLGTFETDWETLDEEFLRFMQRVRSP